MFTSEENDDTGGGKGEGDIYKTGDEDIPGTNIKTVRTSVRMSVSLSVFPYMSVITDRSLSSASRRTYLFIMLTSILSKTKMSSPLFILYSYSSTFISRR